jgi:hypothetical protein
MLVRLGLMRHGDCVCRADVMFNNVLGLEG